MVLHRSRSRCSRMAQGRSLTAFRSGGDNLQPLSRSTNQASIIALFRVVKRYVGNRADAGRVSRLSGSGGAQH